MKRTFIKSVTAAVLLLAATSASALTPEECGAPRAKFTNVGFVYSHLGMGEYPKLHSDFGVNLTKGRTYYLHRPIAGMLRFGIDAVWTDLNYANYKVNEYYTVDMNSDYMNSFCIHEMGVGVQVGPSVTVNLFKRLQASAYFRYNPSLYCMYSDDFSAGFGNMFTGGFSLNYGVFGLGVETRFGKSKMKVLDLGWFQGDGGGDDYDEGMYYAGGQGYDGTYAEQKTSDKITSKLSGVRAYICLRF